jgi:hypothetical protein
MKKVLALLALVTLLATGSFAANCPLITVNENGDGRLDFSQCGGGVTAMPGVLRNDPGPGGLNNVLTFNLLGPPSLTAGDLGIFDASGLFSDVVRFNDYNTGGVPGYPASLLFYSDPVAGIYDSRADIYSPPTSLYPNALGLLEIWSNGVSSVLYTPASGEPGYVPGFSVTYDIISDTPEPSTIILFTSSLIGAAGVLRHRLL